MKKFNHFLVWFTIAVCAIAYFENESVSIHWVFFWGAIFEAFDKNLLRPLMVGKENV